MANENPVVPQGDAMKIVTLADKYSRKEDVTLGEAVRAINEVYARMMNTVDKTGQDDSQGTAMKLTTLAVNRSTHGCMSLEKVAREVENGYKDAAESLINNAPAEPLNQVAQVSDRMAKLVASAEDVEPDG